MKKEDIRKAIEEVKKNSSKRNFKQTFDLIITYKNLDLKKTDNQLDFYATLPHTRGKEVTTCALVGPELLSNAKEQCTTAVSVDDFDAYAKDNKLVKKLAQDHDYFIAQATSFKRNHSFYG